MEIEQADIMRYLDRLWGVWVGAGTGEFPTIATFRYREILTFTPIEGKPVLHYEQRTWRKDESGKEFPSHWETGFWRVLPNNEVEMVCAQSGVRVEMANGKLVPEEDGFSLGMDSTLISDEQRVAGTRRDFHLQGGVLRYFMKMKTSTVPVLTLHVQASLKPGA